MKPSLTSEQARQLRTALAGVVEVAEVVLTDDGLEVFVWSESAARQVWRTADEFGIPEGSLAVIRPITFLQPYPGNDARNDAAYEEFLQRNVRVEADGTRTLVSSMEPVVDSRSTLIVLGSMPGTVSLERNQYYAHHRDRFWHVVGEILDVEPRTYEDQIRMALNAGIALWDVFKQCTRVGSLDRRISTRSEVPNDLSGFLEEHQTITTILFNGRKAADAFGRHIEPALSVSALDRLSWHVLPSTSPGNAKVAYAALLAAWRSGMERAGIRK